MRRFRTLVGLICTVVLAACSSTAPQATGIAAPTTPAAGSTTAVASTSADTSQASAGPVTPSMATLNITGERYSTLGDPNAPVTMIEFSDYGCPFCRAYSTSAFNTIKQRYVDTGQVYYVFKDFPILTLHPQASLAAQAAECAGVQGKYWDMHNQLFAAPKEWDGNSPETAQNSFRRYAAAVGLEPTAFDQCITGAQFADDVQLDFSEGRGLGLTGTPTFIINGKLLTGARPVEQFVQILDRELAQR